MSSLLRGNAGLFVPRSLVVFLPLLLLVGCQVYSTNVLHRFSDDALEIAARASPDTDWEPEFDPVRQGDVAYPLPHTELVTLRGRVDDVAMLFENLEIEAVRTLLRSNMYVLGFQSKEADGLHTYRWVYRWAKCEGVLTIWGRRLEGDEFILAVTIHESRVETW